MESRTREAFGPWSIASWTGNRFQAHALRSASSGCTEAARRAGTQHATNATRLRIATTDAHVDELLKHVNAHYDTIGTREMNLRRRYQKQATFPRIGFLPVTGRMLTDDHGTVWIQRVDIVANPVEVEWSRGPARPTYWDVFDSTGTFQHIVRLPPRFALRAVRDSIAIGVGRDELDVQYIVGYRISRKR